MRDIPAQYIVAGTTKSNLRQIVQQKMKKDGLHCQCVRCREIRKSAADFTRLHFDVIRYDTSATTEYFLQALTEDDKLAGFLRLSHPKYPRDELNIPEIRHSAMIRELHVYGPAQELGSHLNGVQHQGLGTDLLDRAVLMSQQKGFAELSVISAIGTRHYYRERGFIKGHLYPTRTL